MENLSKRIDGALDWAMVTIVIMSLFSISWSLSSNTKRAGGVYYRIIQINGQEFIVQNDGFFYGETIKAKLDKDAKND